MDNLKIPRHIAIIMDGNGRWAKRQGLPRIKGHGEGLNTLRKVVELCKDKGVGYLTVYAFSTENWRRPKTEVDFLLGLLKRFLREEVKGMNENNVRLRIIGSREGLSKTILREIEYGEEATKDNDGMVLNIAFNYGGRREIVDAFNALRSVEGDMTEEAINNALYTSDCPDPELVIRTSGEFRVSNFLLWQIAYSEFYITDILWPDFNEAVLDEAILKYNSRERRFGGV